MTEPIRPSDDVLDRVAATIASRRGADPASSYVAALFAKGNDAILTGKDFTSKRTGNRYRFEGFHIGKEEMPLRRFSTFRVPIAELGSEATIWNWSTVAK